MQDTILHGDALAMLRTLPDNSVHCCVTSPPYYGLRDYGVPRQLGLEATPATYVARLVEVFTEVKRVLHDDGTLWVNLGDTYNQDSPIRKSAAERIGAHPIVLRRRYTGTPKLKRKDLIGIPWMVAMALRDEGWYLRSDVIWAKTAIRPEGRICDRPDLTHEHVFMLTKRAKHYHFDRELAQSWGTVWRIPVGGSNVHGAVFSIRLVERCILAGCPVGGIVLDPFFGSGTVGEVAIKHNRHYLGIELNAEYITLAEERLGKGIQRVLWSSVG